MNINSEGITDYGAEYCGNGHWKSLGHEGTIKGRDLLLLFAKKCLAPKDKRYYDQLWHRWYSMKYRCYSPKATGYKDYGGRGISVCTEWRNSYEVFKNWAMMTGYKENLSLDRIDVNGNYCPENCRWIPFNEQQKNKQIHVKKKEDK